MTSLPITLVIPVRGSADLLIRLLDAVDRAVTASASGTLRVLVSDDGSEPPLGAVVGAALSRWVGIDVRVIRSATNGGPGAARNRALAEVETPWVAFLDADMTVDERWFARLREVVATTECDVVEGRVAFASGAPPTPFTHATEFSSSGIHHGAGNVVYRTAVLRAAGGYDESFFDARRGLHFREDTELYFRLYEAGVRTVYDADLVAEHPPLPASYRSPILLARRYGFDPRLSRLHARQFREMNHGRKIGPVSLRRARHDAALAHVAGVTVGVVGVALGHRALMAAGAGLAVAGWGATAGALSWRRHVAPSHLLPLAAVSAIVPWVYVWNYYRGVVRNRHLPRL